MSINFDALTRPTEIISEVRLHDVLAKGGTLRPTGHSLLANSKTNAGRELGELLVLGILASAVAQDALVNVLRSVVATVHGTAAALDARPLGDIASAEVRRSVWRAIDECEAAFISIFRYKASWNTTYLVLILTRLSASRADAGRYVAVDTGCETAMMTSEAIIW